jgi:hypothetical protein
MIKVLFFSVWVMFHPVHVTLTSIDYIPESVSFKVFVRMYFDDFLVDCSKNGSLVQKDGFSGENPKTVEALEKYLTDKIVLEVNNNQLLPKLQNLTLVDNELSVNLIYEGVKKPRIITVKNLIMTGLYTDMANMVIVRINEFEEAVKLTPDNTERTFKIK